MTAPRYTCCETVLRNNTWSPIVNLKSSGLVVDHCVSLQYLGCLGSLQFQNDNRLFLTDYQAVSEKAGQDVLHGPIGPLQVFAFTNCPAVVLIISITRVGFTPVKSLGIVHLLKKPS